MGAVLADTFFGHLGMYLLSFSFAFGFLFFGPYLGVKFGLSVRTCLALHCVESAVFGFVPVQFAFGFIQLSINMWACLPRLIMIGCNSLGDVAKRIDDGWAVASI